MATRYQETFSFAELDYLLGGSDRWPALRARLAFPNSSDPDAFATAGLASLLARRLISKVGEELVVDASGVLLARALLEPATNVDLSWADADSMRFGVLFAAADPVLLSVVAPGVVELTALNGGRPLADVVSDIILSTTAEGAFMALGASGSDPILIGRTADGWRLGGDPDKGEPASADESTVRAAIGRVVNLATDSKAPQQL